MPFLPTLLLLIKPQAALQRSCTKCHRLDVIYAQHLSREEWSRELDKMTSMGAMIERREQLLNYLARHFRAGLQ